MWNLIDISLLYKKENEKLFNMLNGFLQYFLKKWNNAAVLNELCSSEELDPIGQ